jgi:hypothetical protein
MEQNWYDKINFWDFLEKNMFQSTDIHTFYKNYPFNGSSISDISSKNLDLMLVMDFNPQGIKGLEKFADTTVPEYLILILYFPWAKRVQIDWDFKQELPFDEIYVDIKKMDDEFIETILESVFFHKIKILHKKELYVTLFDKNGNIIKLSNL